MLQLPQEKQVAILDRWRELILSSYPADAAAFFGRQKDRFANPVGEAIRRGTAVLLGGMLADESPSSAPMTEALDALVRIRAVQDFTPAQAVAFVFRLKQAFREVLAPPPREGDFPAELDARVDGLALAAFDHYTRCREQIYDIKVREIRNRTARRFTRADLSFEDTANKSNQDNGGDGSGDKGAAR
jgi:hypothetical protein